MTHEYNGVRSIKDTYYQYIFVTDDKCCAAIGQTLKVRAAIDYGKVIYNQTLIDYDFPHWRQKESFLLSMSQEIFYNVTKRAITRNNLSEEEYQLELDTITENSSQQISKLTREITVLTKKGFG